MKRRSASDPATTVPPRQRRRRLVESVLVVIGCLLLLDAFIGERGVVATRRARAIYDQQKQVLDEAHAEGDRLKEELQQLTDDPATIEDAARRDLFLMKPGEKIFTINDIKADADTH